MLDKIKQELNKRNSKLILPKREQLKINKDMNADRISEIISEKLMKRIENTLANNM